MFPEDIEARGFNMIAQQTPIQMCILKTPIAVPVCAPPPNQGHGMPCVFVLDPRTPIEFLLYPASVSVVVVVAGQRMCTLIERRDN